MSRLQRSLGLPALLFYGVGVIVGAGIYSILGAAAGIASRGVWLSLLLACVPALLAAVCYAELASRFPRAGGAYSYFREAFPAFRSGAFLVGFAMVATEAATAATVGIAFGGYLALFASVPVWLSALLLIAACTALNIAGIREATWAAVLCTTIEVIGLLVIVGAGSLSGRFGEGAFDVRWTAIAPAAALCFFVFTGFEGLANLAEEAKDPKRQLPLALLLSLAFTTVLYVLVALAAVALVSPEALAESSFPLATAAGAAHPKLAPLLAWIALFSTANTALITLVVGSRLLYGMADQGDLPPLLGRTLEARRTPWVAALVLAATAATLLPLGSVAWVGSVSSLLTLAVFASVGCSLIALRRRAQAGEGFRVPWSVARVPVPAALLVVFVLAFAAYFEAKVHFVVLAFVAAGIALALLRQRAGWVAVSEARR